VRFFDYKHKKNKKPPLLESLVSDLYLRIRLNAQEVKICSKGLVKKGNHRKLILIPSTGIVIGLYSDINILSSHVFDYKKILEEKGYSALFFNSKRLINDIDKVADEILDMHFQKKKVLSKCS
jgi:hypothetical protein